MVYKVDWGDGNVDDYASNPFTSSSVVRPIDERITSAPNQESWYLDRKVEEAYALNTIGLSHTYDAPGEYTIKVLSSAGSYIGLTYYYNTTSLFINSRAKHFYGAQVKDIVKSTFLEKYKNNKIRLVPSQSIFCGIDLANIPSEGITAMPINFSPRSNSTSLHGRFSGLNYYSSTPASVDISSWDTSRIKNMQRCFSLANANFIGIGSLDTGSVTDMGSCFFAAKCLADEDLSSWDTSSVINMENLFSYISLNSGETLNVSGWDTSNVQDMSGILLNLTCDDNAIDVSGWDTSNVKNLNRFMGNSSVSLDFSGWDVGRCLSFYQAFQSSTANPDISSWNIGENVPDNVPKYYKVFTGNTAVGGNDPDCTDSIFLSGQQIPDFPDKLIETRSTNNHVGIDFSKMFLSNTGFNRDISGWDTSKVSNFNEMFQGATSFDQDLSSWDWSGVPDGGKVCGRNPKNSPWSENAFYDMFKGSGMSTSNINKVITSMYNHVVATGHPKNMLCEHAFNSTGNTRTLMTADDPTIDAKISTLVNDYNWEINIPA